jgi:hypothetical protein
MTSSQLQKRLQKLGACEKGLKWAKGKSLTVAWATCKRDDWMLWLAAPFCSRKWITLAICDCAELFLPYVMSGEDRVRKAIETARAWAEGPAARGVGGMGFGFNSWEMGPDASVVYGFGGRLYFLIDGIAYDAPTAPRIQKQCADLIRRRIPIMKLIEAMGEGER